MHSHRISGDDQSKVLAVVVTSVLAVLPDGYKRDKIQYDYKNSPIYLLSDYSRNDNDIIIDKLDTAFLKDCLSVPEEAKKLVNEYFEKDLQDAINFLLDDINHETLNDSIDYKVKESVKKRRKQCENGHINDIKTKARKYCDRPSCKSLLKDSLPSTENSTTQGNKDQIKVQNYYYNF